MPDTTRIILLSVAVFAVYLALSTLGRFDWEGSVCEMPVAVEILNGCGQPGIAEKVASHLRDGGFDVMYVGNADDFDYGETVVIDRTGDRDKALAVAGVLGRAQVVCQVSSAFFVDVTVVLGSDAGTSPWLAGYDRKPL